MIQNWPRIRELFQDALELPRSERRAFVAREAGGEPQVEAEVLRLLEQERAEDPFLEPPRAGDVLTALSAPLSVSVGEEVGGYRIERLLGRGGMGSVYAARQRRPDRVVALKVMGNALGAESVRRFEVEAEILGRLRHPGIAAIYELGLHERADGVPLSFFAMELVEGARDLVRYAREEALDQPARLELVREVCAAVHHAHQRGVIHRDLKPGNILVDSGGRAKVIDYGVARASEPGVARGVETQAGHLLGTLQYISPEQLSGDPLGVDVRSDVYALGVVLYELLADRVPYEVEGKSITEVVAEVCERVPLPPSTHRPELAQELDWIVMKALAKERDRRYDSAAALADDLERFARDEPVLAGPETKLYRVRKFVRRHRLVVAAGLMAFVSLVGGAVVTGLALVEAHDRTVEAEESQVAEAEEAEKARRALNRQSALLDTVQRQLLAEREEHAATRPDVFLRSAGSLEDDPEEEPAARARRLNKQVRAFSSMGLTDEATRAAKSALAALDTLPDPDLRLRGELQLFLTRQSILETDFEQAHAALNEGVEDLRRSGEPIGEAELMARRLQAELLEKSGRIEEAAAAYGAALEDSLEVLGTQSPLALALMSEYGLLLSGLGRQEEAEEQTRRAYELSKRALVPEDPQLHMAGMRLGMVLKQRGKLEGLVALQQSVVDGVIASQGEMHRNVPVALYALAGAQLATAEVEDAEVTAARALDLVLTHHPNDVELEVYVCEPLVVALVRLDLEEDAMALLEENANRMQTGGMAGHPRLARVRTTLGDLYLEAGRAEDAERELSAAHELARTTLPAGHARTLHAQASHGAALLALERFAQAERELRGAYDSYSAGSSPAEQAAARELLADLTAVYAELQDEEQRARFEALLTSR